MSAPSPLTTIADGTEHHVNDAQVDRPHDIQEISDRNGSSLEVEREFQADPALKGWSQKENLKTNQVFEEKARFNTQGVVAGVIVGIGTNAAYVQTGFLDEALDFIHAVPQKADASIWGAVLASYRLHKDIKIAEIAARNLLRLEPYNSANYVLMMNIYSTFDR
ncbi:hypothetical protein JHK84_045210 [Glycine max]|nr:hypothetical protein JHK86_045152 [Glycine max]KAG5108303.1 hypothetical protein JHK84_045210 [Glycine max]